MDRRSDCPVACSLDVLGDKWSLLIIRDMGYYGKSTFKDFEKSEEGIATNILSNRLKKMMDHGIIHKEQSESNKLVYHYSLTKKGVDLAAPIIGLSRWAVKYIPEVNDIFNIK